MPVDPPLVLEDGLFVREDGWCPAKGPTETKPSKQAGLSLGQFGSVLDRRAG